MKIFTKITTTVLSIVFSFTIAIMIIVFFDILNANLNKLDDHSSRVLAKMYAFNYETKIWSRLNSR